MGILDLAGEGIELAVGAGEEGGHAIAEGIGLRNTGEETAAEKQYNKEHEGERKAAQAKIKKQATRKGNSYTVGASCYGGAGDPSSGHIGSSGKDLTGTLSFAELAMGKALGGMPYGTKLRLTWRQSGETTPKQIIIEKLDIGLGGSPVTGKNVGDGKTATKIRRIDLWHEDLRALGIKDNGQWTGLVQIERLDGKPIPGLGGAEAPYDVHGATYGTGNTTESEQPEPGKQTGAIGFLGELTLKKVLLLLVALGLGGFALMWLSKDITGATPIPVPV